VPYLILVLHPVPIVLKDAEYERLSMPFSPQDPRTVTEKVYIGRSDFREVDNEGYRGLAPSGAIG
jgi:hypothetical protein